MVDPDPGRVLDTGYTSPFRPPVEDLDSERLPVRMSARRCRSNSRVHTTTPFPSKSSVTTR